MKSGLPLALVILAGCTQPLAPPASDPGTAILLDGVGILPGQVSSWTRTLLYSPADELRCGPDNCEVRTFTVQALPGDWTLQVALDWAASHTANNADYDPQYPSFNMTLRGPRGESAYAIGAKFGSVLHVERPAPGTWTLEIRITHMLRDWDLSYFADLAGVGPVPVDPGPVPTSGTYDARIGLFARAPPASGPMLPDLVVRDLDQLRIEYAAPGLGNQYMLPSMAHPLRPGCTVDEADETGATRCLRFSVGVGNDGAGPFVLAADRPADDVEDFLVHAQQARMGAIQCVADPSGATLRPAGNVTFSRSHGHMHFDGILGYLLYAYDLANGTRLAQIGEGAKLGYGPFGEALVHDGRRLAGPWDLQVGCEGMRDPVGLNAGWYDYYLWWRTSQYIDIEGVADGVYELEATFDPDNNILESDDANNAGSVVLRITGNHVEVLRPFTFRPRDH